MSEQAGISKLREGYGLSAVAADFDKDGWPDIYVACDSTPSLLLMNNHDGTFSEEGVMRGVALSEDGMEQAGMGIGVGDYDLDGALDFFKTHFVDDANGLYRNDGKGNSTTLRAARIGVETHYICWGAGMVDLDNDGWPDIFMVTGTVYPEVEKKLPNYAASSPRVVFPQSGKRNIRRAHRRSGPGVASPTLQPGMRFRRLRQRRRPRYSGRQSQ